LSSTTKIGGKGGLFMTCPVCTVGVTRDEPARHQTLQGQIVRHLATPEGV